MSRSRGATEGSLTRNPGFRSRCQWHRTSPSSNSSPRSLILSPATPPGKCLGGHVAPFPALSGNQDALSVTWGRVVRKKHGGGTVPIALSDHGHPPVAAIKWTRHPRNSPHPPPFSSLSLETRMAPGDCQVSVDDLNIGGRKHTIYTELWPFLTRSSEVVSTLHKRSRKTTHINTIRAQRIPPRSPSSTHHHSPGSLGRAHTGKITRPYITISRNRIHQMVCYFLIASKNPCPYIAAGHRKHHPFGEGAHEVGPASAESVSSGPAQFRRSADVPPGQDEHHTYPPRPFQQRPNKMCQ